MNEATTDTMTIDRAAPDPMVENPQVEIFVSGQRDLNEIAADIVSQKDRAAQSFIEIGKLLVEAKEQLTRHGQWLQWLSDCVDISERMAQRYMQLAKAFPNPTPMSDLGMTKLLALLPLPEECRDDFISERHEVDGKHKTIGKMSTREVKKVVRKKMDALKRESDEYWIIPQQTPYTSIASNLESAQKHLDAALKSLERQKWNPIIKGKFHDDICSLNETVQRCLALIAVGNPHASE